MRVCLLVDGLGASEKLLSAALSTWVAPGRHVTEAWLVRDIGPPEGKIHVLYAEKRNVFVHVPTASQLDGNATKTQERLRSYWPPWPSLEDRPRWELPLWHSYRRWLLLTADFILERLFSEERGCPWLLYTRAKAFVDVKAWVSVIEHLQRQALLSVDGVHALSRIMDLKMHGTGTSLELGGNELFSAALSSSGLLLSRKAVARLATGAHIFSPFYNPLNVAQYFLNLVDTHLIWRDLLMAQEDGLEGSITELVFAACMYKVDPHLRIRSLPHQEDYFITGHALLQRFAFRLGAASFGWSKVDLDTRGIHSDMHERHKGWQSLPPMCVLGFYPVETTLLHDLFETTSLMSCLPTRRLSQSLPGSIAGSNLSNGVAVRTPASLGDLVIWASGQTVLVQTSWRRSTFASQSSRWRAALRKNRKLFAKLVAQPSDFRSHCFRDHCFAPARREAYVREADAGYLYQKEHWFGPAGQVRLRPLWVTIAATPNGGTSWFSSMLEIAMSRWGTLSTFQSEVLNPHYNSLLKVELEKIYGEANDPNSGLWQQTFLPSTAAAYDLILEMARDMYFATAIPRLQTLRMFGIDEAGSRIPPRFIWASPKKSQMDLHQDSMVMRAVIWKETLSTYHLMQHLHLRRARAQPPTATIVTIFRDRAHTFPMSGLSALNRGAAAGICKVCWFQSSLRSFEKVAFRDDPPLFGLQKWWHHWSGKAEEHDRTMHEVIFSYLLTWYTILRAVPLGIFVVEYKQLMVLDRLELKHYLNSTLPKTLVRMPDVNNLAFVIASHRYPNPAEFLRQREVKYAHLGIEGFAQAVVSEMQRLDASADLRLLNQST